MKLILRYTNKYLRLLIAALLGSLIIPLGLWTELAKGFSVFANSLIGLSAVFTAWWAYKTFAFKERINEYKNIYEGLKRTESAYLDKYGAHLRLLNALSEVDVSTLDIVADYKKQINHIEQRYREAEDFLNDLSFSPFVSNNFKAQLLLLIRVKQFSDDTEVQNAFFKIKILHKEEFIIKT